MSAHAKETGEASQERTIWPLVWDLYAHQRQVFDRAFGSIESRHSTRFDSSSRSDLIHSFLLTRAAPALRTFEPDKGRLASWLFVVFRRYVLQHLRAEQRRRQLLTQLATPVEPTTDPYELRDDRRAVQRVLELLPDDESRVVKAYYHAGSPSLRSTAQELGYTTWKTRQLLHAGTERVRRELLAQAPSITGEYDVDTKTNQAISNDFALFLSKPVVQSLNPEVARGFIAEAAGSAAAGEALQKHPEHAWAILEAMADRAEASPEEMAEVRTRQDELLVAASAVLKRIDAHNYPRIESAFDAERAAAELPLMTDVTKTVVPVALALSEIILTIGSILAGGDRVVAEKGEDYLRLVHEREGRAQNLPVSYLASHVAEHSGLDDQMAEAVSSAALEFLVEASPTGVLGLRLAVVDTGRWEFIDELDNPEQ